LGEEEGEEGTASTKSAIAKGQKMRCGFEKV
jgi:hypothetical protein